MRFFPFFLFPCVALAAHAAVSGSLASIRPSTDANPWVNVHYDTSPASLDSMEESFQEVQNASDLSSMGSPPHDPLTPPQMVEDYFDRLSGDTEAGSVSPATEGSVYRDPMQETNGLSDVLDIQNLWHEAPGEEEALKALFKAHEDALEDAESHIQKRDNGIKLALSAAMGILAQRLSSKLHQSMAHAMPLTLRRLLARNQQCQQAVTFLISAIASLYTYQAASAYFDHHKDQRDKTRKSLKRFKGASSHLPRTPRRRMSEDTPLDSVPN